MEEKAGKVTFQGTAASIDDVSLFMTALKGSRFFGDVELKKTTAKVESGYRVTEFDIMAGARYSPVLEAAAAAPAPAPAGAPAQPAPAPTPPAAAGTGG